MEHGTHAAGTPGHNRPLLEPATGAHHTEPHPSPSRLHDTRQLLSQKEHEIIRLREQALKQLEQQLDAKQQQFAELQAKFDILKTDFTYNLELLQGRDQELESYDAAFAAVTGQLNDKERQLSELQASVAQAHSDLRIERQKYAEAQAARESKLQELQQLLEEARSSKSEALLRQREDYEHQKRSLQVTSGSRGPVMTTASEWHMMCFYIYQ